MHRSQRTGLADLADDPARAPRGRRARPGRRGWRSAGCAGRAWRPTRRACRACSTAGCHVLGVEGAGDRQRDQPGLRGRVGGERLRAARRVPAATIWPAPLSLAAVSPCSLERREHLVAVAAEDGGHAGRGDGGGLGHRVAALADEHHRLLGGDRPGAGGGGRAHRRCDRRPRRRCRTRRPGAGRAPGRRPGRRRPAAAGRPRCRGSSRRRPRCRSGRGRCPATAESQPQAVGERRVLEPGRRGSRGSGRPGRERR